MMSTMLTKPVGTHMTAGEIVEHLSQLAPTDKVFIVLGGYEYPIRYIENGDIMNDDRHPYPDAYNLLEELHEFTGTKKDMIKMIAAYFEGV